MEIQESHEVAFSHEATDLSMYYICTSNTRGTSVTPLMLLQCLCPVSVAEGLDQTPSLLTPTPQTYVRHALKTLGVTCNTHGYFPHALQASALSGARGVLCVHCGCRCIPPTLPPVCVYAIKKVTFD